MSWTEREFGDVKLTHHSTSSNIKLTVTDRIHEQFIEETIEHVVWLDYTQFEDLKKAIKASETI